MRVLFSGGGTGGHIYPALAIAKALQLKYPETEFLFVGTERGLESRVVPQAGFDFEVVNVAGLSRRNPVQAARSLIQAGRALARARQIVRAFAPDVAVGTGGYVSGPVIAAAVSLGVPTLIHEQNAFPGLTTRWLSRFAHLVAVSHEEAIARLPRARRIKFVGMPIRDEFFSLEKAEGRTRMGLPTEGNVILSVGGSGGAAKLNDTLVQAAPQILHIEDLMLLQVTGERYYERVCEQAARLSLSEEQRKRWQVIRYLHDMPAGLSAADLVLSRGGSSTLAEIAAVGVPAIVVPSPNVTDNHQEYNARSLAAKGAAVVMRDDLLTPQTLVDNVASLVSSSSTLDKMRQASRQAGRPQATDDLVNLVRELGKR